MSGIPYTNEQCVWLVNNIDKYDSYSELASAFNSIFSQTRTSSSISDKCIKQLKIHIGKNSGRFGKKRTNYSRYLIGDEVWKSTGGGYWWIKVDNKYHKGTTTMEDYSENWKPKHIWLWEQFNGELPKDKIIIFLDNDHNNVTIDNLYMVDRGIHAVMCKNRWYTSVAENTLTAIKYCELWNVLHKGGL